MKLNNLESQLNELKLDEAAVEKNYEKTLLYWPKQVAVDPHFKKWLVISANFARQSI